MHTGYYMSVYLVWCTYDVNMTQNHWSMRLNFSLTLETAHHWTHNHSGQHLFWGWRTCILELTNRWRRYMNHLEFSAADKESDLSDWLYTILNDFIETFFFFLSLLHGGIETPKLDPGALPWPSAGGTQQSLGDLGLGTPRMLVTSDYQEDHTAHGCFQK